MEQLIERCVAWTVGQAEIMACARVPDDEDRMVEHVRAFPRRPRTFWRWPTD